MTDLAHRTRRDARAALAAAFGLLASAAVLAALVVLVAPSLGTGLYPNAPRATLDPGAATAIQLVAHNTPVALWPLALLALDWHQIPVVRRFADGLVGAQLALHGASVGAALATWPELVRWLPHLPAEWAAIALPCAAWVPARRGLPADPANVGLVAAATIVLLALAAVLETWVVPS